MSWLLESSNYFVEVSKDDFDHNLPHSNTSVKELNTFDEAFEYFQKMKVFINCFHSDDTVLFLYKDCYKYNDNSLVYKNGPLIGIQSSLKVESPETVFLKFVHTPTSDNNNCWTLFPIRRRYDRRNIGGVVLEVPLYWDIRLNEDFSRDFIFAYFIGDSDGDHLKIYWNVGLESKDINTLWTFLEDQILCYYKEVDSYYDFGELT